MSKTFEILPAKRGKLKDHLYTELKNQTKWKENRSDAIQDQCNYYESYLGKEYYIQKDLIPELLKDAEKVHLNYLNYHLLNRMRFLEAKALEDGYMLYLFDNDDKQLNLVNFLLETSDEVEIELLNQGSTYINVDTRAREIKCYNNSLLVADMYSLYSCHINLETCELDGFTKQFTFDETPTQWLSDIMLDKILLLNNNSINFIDCNQNVLLQTKSLTNNTLRSFTKCDFFNIPVNIILYNKTQCVLSDVRVK
jgi:hypothetical protein